MFCAAPACIRGSQMDGTSNVLLARQQYKIIAQFKIMAQIGVLVIKGPQPAVHLDASRQAIDPPTAFTLCIIPQS